MISQIQEDLLKIDSNISLNLKEFIINNPNAVKRMNYEKKSNLINEGDKGEYIFFIVEGYVKLFIKRYNKKMFIKILKSGDFLGLAMLSDRDIYPYSLISIDNSVVYLIDKEIFKQSAYNDPHLMQSTLNILADLLNDLYSKLISLSFKQMNGRIAEALLYFSDEIFRKDKFEIPLTRKQLGEFSNVSAENVTRILKSYAFDKIISINKNKIIIINKRRLSDISLKG